MDLQKIQQLSDCQFCQSVRRLRTVGVEEFSFWNLNEQWYIFQYGYFLVICIWLCIDIEVLKLASGGHRKPYQRLNMALIWP